MTKLEILQNSIDKINGDWASIGSQLNTFLQKGEFSLMKAYLMGIAQVVYIKGAPKKIVEELRLISSLI